MTTRKTKPVDPELVNAVREQVLEELKSEQQRKHQEALVELERNKKARTRYINEIKKSSEPWVDVIGFTETNSGVRVELDWNDAFVIYLKENGVTGADDEQIIQKWVALLLRDIADRMEERMSDSADSRYE